MSILARIQANGGDVIRDEWRFSLRRGKLTDKAITWITANMQEVRRDVWPLYDEWEERAAIREFDGGEDRIEAEAAAYWEVSHA